MTEFGPPRPIDVVRCDYCHEPFEIDPTGPKTHEALDHSGLKSRKNICPRCRLGAQERGKPAPEPHADA